MTERLTTQHLEWLHAELDRLTPCSCGRCGPDFTRIVRLVVRELGTETHRTRRELEDYCRQQEEIIEKLSRQLHARNGHD